MPGLSEFLKSFALLAGYTFTPILFVIAVALFIHIVLRYRRQVIDSDEENAIIDPSRRYSLDLRGTNEFRHSNFPSEEALLTEPRILPLPFSCLEDQADILRSNET
jgi:hypothetical protein